MREKWAGADVNHARTCSLRYARPVYFKSAWLRFSTHHGPLADARGCEVREKWAGADLNCGYGHPKAEGYQATPPARISTVDPTRD